MRQVSWRACALQGPCSLWDSWGERCSGEENLVSTEFARWTEVTPQVKVGSGWGQVGRQHDAGSGRQTDRQHDAGA